jgi:hypothetical protein
MEPEPRLDASRPSPLRLWGFIAVVVGALLAGVGAIQTWVTVGIEGAPDLDTATKGTDLTSGRLVLLGAIAMLVGIVGTRLTQGRVRLAIAVVIIATAALVGTVGVWFAVTAPSSYSPVDNVALVDALARATGTTPEQVREVACQAIGCVTTVGWGPWGAAIGGWLGVAGGTLALAWAARTAASPDGPEPGMGEVEG